MVNIERQLAFIDSACKFSVRLFSEFVGDSATDIARKTMLSRLNMKKGKWVKRAFMINTAAVRKIESPRLLNDLIQDMIENESIEESVKDNARGKPAKLYRTYVV